MFENLALWWNMRRLKNPRASVRRRGARALGKCEINPLDFRRGGGSQATEALIAALQDPEICEVAAGSLGELRIRRAIPSLIGLLGEARFRAAASGALVKIGTPAVGPLIEELGRTVGEVTFLAIAEVLVSVPDEAAVGHFTQCLGSRVDWVRKSAAIALARAGQPKWVEYFKGDDEDLARLARSGEPEAFAILTRALDCANIRAPEALVQCDGARARPILLELLKRAPYDVDDKLQAEAVTALCKLAGADAVLPVIEMLLERSRRGHWNEDVSAATGAALVSIGPPAAPGLIRALDRGGADFRVMVILTLGTLGDTQAIQPLMNSLLSGAGTVRRAAAVALGKLGAPTWSGIVKGDDEDFVKLAQSGVRVPFDILVDRLQCGSPAAARALAELGDPRSLQPLISALGDEEASAAAREALCKLGWEPESSEEKRCFYLLALSDQELGQLAQRGKVTVQMLCDWLEFYSGGGYKYGAKALRALAAVKTSDAEAELVRILRGGGPYAEDVRDMLNLGPTGRDHVLCPRCRAYLGIRSELKAAGTPISDVTREAALTRGTLVLSDVVSSCPQCGAQVLL